MDFRPPRRLGLGLGGAITLIALGLAGFLVVRLLQTPPSLASLGMGITLALLLAVAGLFGYWSYGCLIMRYRLGDDQLRITWGMSRHSIPLGNIERIVPGDEFPDRPRVKGVNWPGYHVGWAALDPLGRTLFYSTHRQASQLLYLVTPTVTFAISPANQAQLAQELQARKQARASEMAEVATPSPSWHGLTLFSSPDNVALLVLGLILNLGLFAYVLYHYPSLPSFLPLHYTPTGQIDQVGMREALLWLPGGGLAVLLLNLILASFIHQRERLAALVSLGAVALVQVLVWVSAISIIT